MFFIKSHCVTSIAQLTGQITAVFSDWVLIQLGIIKKNKYFALEKREKVRVPETSKNVFSVCKSIILAVIPLYLRTALFCGTCTTEEFGNKVNNRAAMLCQMNHHKTRSNGVEHWKMCCALMRGRTYLISFGLVRGGHMSQILDHLLGVLCFTST